MLLKFLIYILIAIISFVIAILPLFSKKTDSLFRSMVISGIGLICSAFPATIDSIIFFLASITHLPSYESPNTDYFQIFIGFVLIALAFVHQKILQNKLYILNMQGATRHYVANDKYLDDLNIADHQVRELVIDTGWACENFKKLNKSQWKSLRAQIEDTIAVFCNKDFGKSFTGMAPIPLSMFAGTCYKSQAISSFIEYDNKNDVYRRLDKSRKFPELKVITQDCVGSEDVVVAISTTSRIADADIEQFKCPLVRIECEECHDNRITSLVQLKEYVECISRQLERLSKHDIKRIHLICATQSSLAFVLGEKIAHMQNRLAEIISYHYVSSEKPCYVKGIIIAGANRGCLYEPK